MDNTAIADLVNSFVKVWVWEIGLPILGLIAFFQVWFGVRSINREAKKQTRLLAWMISRGTQGTETVQEVLQSVSSNAD
jgi:hypothetical protein